jgi:hypothetical protein
MNMKPSTQIEISAQVWVCDSCGGTDRKSCSCRATAHSEELKKKKEQDRQRAKAYRDRAASHDADIENTEEPGKGHCNGRSGKNAVGKPYSESHDPNYKLRHTPPSISRLYAPQHGRLPFRGDGQVIEAKESQPDPETASDLEVERDRKECIALFEKVKEAEREAVAASRDADIENTKESGNSSAVFIKVEPKPSVEPFVFAKVEPSGGPIPSRRERKRTAELLRLVDGLITAGLARGLLGELKAHGTTFLVEALEDRLSLGREEEESSSTALLSN